MTFQRRSWLNSPREQNNGYNWAGKFTTDMPKTLAEYSFWVLFVAFVGFDGTVSWFWQRIMVAKEMFSGGLIQVIEVEANITSLEAGDTKHLTRAKNCFKIA